MAYYILDFIKCLEINNLKMLYPSILNCYNVEKTDSSAINSLPSIYIERDCYVWKLATVYVTTYILQNSFFFFPENISLSGVIFL